MASTVDLFDAIDAGDVDTVRVILDADPSLASARDDHGVSAILHARYRQDRVLVAVVAEHEPAQDVFDAAAAGDLDALVRLLDVDPLVTNAHAGDGFTPLHLAAYFGRADAARILLDRGAEVDARGTGWMTGTALHSAASASHAEVIEVLLDAGADPNARQSHGWTPLHAASANGDLASIAALLARGADPNAANDEGATPASLASTREARAALAS